MSTQAGMSGIMALMAKIASREDLIKLLESEIADFKETILLHKPKEEQDDAFQKLTISCMLILAKHADIDPLDAIQKTEQVESAMKIFNPDKS